MLKADATSVNTLPSLAFPERKIRDNSTVDIRLVSGRIPINRNAIGVPVSRSVGAPVHQIHAIDTIDEDLTVISNRIAISGNRSRASSRHTGNQSHLIQPW